MKEEKIKQIIENSWKMALTSRKHVEEPRRAAGEIILSHHQATCLTLLKEMQSASMGELAAQAGVSSQQLTRIINELEEMGCVERCAGENRRQVFVRLTDKGEQTLQHTMQCVYDYTLKRFEKFSEEELDEFMTHLTALFDFWNRLHN